MATIPLNIATVRTLALVGLVASAACGCLWLVLTLAFLLLVFVPWVTSIRLGVVELCLPVLLAVCVYLWFALAKKMNSIRAAAGLGDVKHFCDLNSTGWTITTVLLGLANMVLGLMTHVLDELFTTGFMHEASFPLLASLLVIVVGLVPSGSMLLITSELRRRPILQS